MAKTYNRLEIDVNKKPNSIGIRPVQHDTKSRYLDVCLYENGVPINLTGEQVRITFRKADGSTFFNQGEVTDATAGRCQFALTNEILSEAKAVEAQISVWNAGGEVLSTQVFEIYVSAAIPWTDAVESENEYGVLVVLFQEIQDALDTMHKIATTFGEPGDKAAEYGVDTFWGILETLAGRGDVESALEKKIKAYLNSTIGTSEFQSLDKLLFTPHGTQTFTSNGTFTVPAGVTKIWVTACGGGAGGGGAIRDNAAGAGGNGGSCIIREPYTVTPNSKINIVIGLGGAAGESSSSSSSSPKSGQSGGTTVIGSLVSLPGGVAQVYATTPNTEDRNIGAGIGGKGAEGSYKSYAEDGENGVRGCGGTGYGYGASYTSGGGGGGSFGNGGNGAYYFNRELHHATNAGYGGGGGGATNDVSSKTASAGGNGIVIIEW